MFWLQVQDYNLHPQETTCEIIFYTSWSLVIWNVDTIIIVLKLNKKVFIECIILQIVCDPHSCF